MPCKSRLRWAKPLLLCLILTATSGCVAASTAPVVNSYCRLAKPITYDTTKDTPDTVAQVEAHNSQWVAVCEGEQG